MTSKNIVLIGFMGTGKTSVGRLVAKKLGRDFIDVDERIEKEQNRKISEIFEKDGEAAFRRLEKAAISQVASSSNAVITTGGGAVLDADNVSALKQSGLLVCLSASPETIFERVKRSSHRPLLKGNDRMAEIKKLLAVRKPFYEKADMKLETDGLSSEKVAQLLLKELEGKLE